MNVYGEIGGLLLAVEDMPPSPYLYVVLAIVGMGVLISIYIIVMRLTSYTKYDMDGQYGGGRGLRNVFRHKRLKRVDRHGIFRGKKREFRDLELEQLLHDGKRSEAAKYLTGLLNTAKAVGDKYTLERYAVYSAELIKMYDDKEAEERGGKALHLKK